MTRWIMALVLLASTTTACALTIEEMMCFETQERLRITVLIRDCATPNLSLTWPIASGEILEPPQTKGWLLRSVNASRGEFTLLVGAGEPEMQFSFLIRFPCETGVNHVFPVARCGANVSAQALQVLLPSGWTAAQWSLGCTRTYDAKEGRVRLSWPGAESGRCEAVIMEPGVGEKEIRWRMSWMAMRGYILITLLAAIVILAAILLHRIAF